MVAAKSYEEKKLSSGQAAKMVGLSKRAFIELLGKYNVSVFSKSISDLQAVSENSINICADLPQLEAGRETYFYGLLFMTYILQNGVKIFL